MLHQASVNLQEKLAAPMERIVTEHGHKIRGMLGAAAPLAAQDDKVRMVAAFCYPLLPGVVRLVVKEAAFVEFVLKHRQQVLGRLESAAAPVLPQA